MIFSPEELAACRDGTLFGSPRSDHVGIQFDWEVPTQAHAPVIFRVRICRGGRESSIRFAIDLDRLQTDDLQTLHDFLAFPPKDYWLVRRVAWLLDISLQQRQPSLSGEERAREVRQLLLART